MAEPFCADAAFERARQWIDAEALPPYEDVMAPFRAAIQDLESAMPGRVASASRARTWVELTQHWDRADAAEEQADRLGARIQAIQSMIERLRGAYRAQLRARLQAGEAFPPSHCQPFAGESWLRSRSWRRARAVRP